MLFYGKTDVGKRRVANEDNFIIKKYSPDTLFAVVCDGMGGAKGGNVASSLAVNTFCEVIDKKEKDHPAFFGVPSEDIVDLLSEAATEANRAVYRQSVADLKLEGMGTTLVGCIITGERAYVVNVGDSRLYMIKNGEIEQVTHDHSYVQYLVDRGIISAEEAKHSSRKNYIIKAVGIAKTVDADFFTCDIETGSYAVLCSDGLTNHLEEDEIKDIVKKIHSSEDIEKSCEDLIGEANRRGGLDNITAVILSV